MILDIIKLIHSIFKKQGILGIDTIKNIYKVLYINQNILTNHVLTVSNQQSITQT